MVKIAFRVDSSYLIGTGHVMRCLTFAKAIRETIDAQCYFFSRVFEGNINDTIKEAGFEVVEMKAPVELTDNYLTHSKWLGASIVEDACEFKSLCMKIDEGIFQYLVVDHYAIDKTWHKIVQSHTSSIVVIDDLGDREHFCDILVDQTFNCSSEKYNGLVPDKCVLLLGTKFAILRNEFRLSKDYVKSIRDKTEGSKILVMFGGSDPDDLTTKVLNILLTRSDVEKVEVIMGASALHLKEIIELCKIDAKFKINVSPHNIAEIMLSSSLAIGAAGATSWERCCTGLPSIVVIQADNQRSIVSELSACGVITSMEIDEIEQKLELHIDEWLDSPDKYNKAVTACLNICDGKGAQRVAKRLLIK